MCCLYPKALSTSLKQDGYCVFELIMNILIIFPNKESKNKTVQLVTISKKLKHLALYRQCYEKQHICR